MSPTAKAVLVAYYFANLFTTSVNVTIGLEFSSVTTYKNVPERSSLDTDINENLIVELYSK